MSINSNPEFTIFTGCMFSGKTSRLLMQLETYKHQKKNVIAFKPKIDTRYDDDCIVSHNGLSVPATTVDNGNDILKHLSDADVDPDVVALDEAFMVKGCASTLVWLFTNVKMTIAVASLDLSSLGKAYPEIKEMMPFATRIEKCSAVCIACGSDAFYTYKKIGENNEEIQVGGAEAYEPRCYSCHPAFGVTHNN